MLKYEQARKYVNRIRNKEKRLYAEKYLAFLVDNNGSPDSGTLSVMAAQAVRMNLLLFVSDDI